MDKISIIIPVYNGAEFLEKTLFSALNQDYENFEVIVIDDCSSDISLQILNSFEEKYNDLIVLVNEKNLGISKTTNKAIEHAKGKYLVFLGHDDLIEKNHLTVMYSEMLSQNAIMIHCNSNVIDSNDNLIKEAVNDNEQLKNSNNPLFTLSLFNYIHNIGYMVNKDIYIRFNQFGKYKNYGEWLSWIEFTKYGNIVYTNKVRSFYRRHDTNITNTFSDLSVIQSMQGYSRECRKKAHVSLKNNNFWMNVKYFTNYLYYEVIYYLRVFKRMLGR